MTRKDYVMLSALLFGVRESLTQLHTNAAYHCDVHARVLARALATQSRAFDELRFLADAGCVLPDHQAAAIAMRRENLRERVASGPGIDYEAKIPRGGIV